MEKNWSHATLTIFHISTETWSWWYLKPYSGKDGPFNSGIKGGILKFQDNGGLLVMEWTYLWMDLD